MMKVPRLEFVCEIHCVLSRAIDVGRTPYGTRRIVEILEGRVVGPEMRGVLMPGGADWQVTRSDNVVELQAHYVIRFDDGVPVQVRNRGLRHGAANLLERIEAGEDVDPAEYYCRTTPVFEAPDGRYEWLNRAIFIATAKRSQSAITLDVFKVL
jgi:Protein of unknown function (DUF3237)